MTDQNLDKIADGLVVSIHYTLTLDNGEEVDSSAGREPLEYIHGQQGIVPGLERELAGCHVGQKLEVKVTPEDGYGPRVAEARQDVPIDQMPEGVQPGMQLQAEAPTGEVMIVHVAEVTAEKVVVDLNHPLAGETLNFAVEVLSVRAATPEELDHGHAHGPGGHDH